MPKVSDNSILKSDNKDNKNSKTSRMKNIDKGDKANKETAFVGLDFNVKLFKNWMKEYYSDKSFNDKDIKIINAHYILTAACQVVCNSLLTGVSDKFSKSKEGLTDLDLDRFKNYILTTSHLNDAFGRFIDKFDVFTDYNALLCVPKKSFDEYVEKNVFHNNKTINMNNETTKFLKFILHQINVMITHVALLHTKYSKKSCVNAEAVMCGIEVYFSGKLLKDIMLKVNEVHNILKIKEKQDSDKGNKNDNDDNGDDDNGDDDNGDDDDKSEDDSEEESDEDEKKTKKQEKLVKKDEKKDEKKPSKKINKKEEKKEEKKDDKKDDKKDVKKEDKKNEKKEDKKNEKKEDKKNKKEESESESESDDD
jgi:hypothetical protein